jgi:hypothetical protein
MKQYSLSNKMVETQVGYALILPTWLNKIEPLTCTNDNTKK